jgi:hypothetical protein
MLSCHMRSALPLASLALLVASFPARADSAGLRLDEYVGAEVSPGWFNLASQPVYGHIPTFSAAPVGTVRFARLETRYFYYSGSIRHSQAVMDAKLSWAAERGVRAATPTAVRSCGRAGYPLV